MSSEKKHESDSCVASRLHNTARVRKRLKSIARVVHTKTWSWIGGSAFNQRVVSVEDSHGRRIYLGDSFVWSLSGKSRRALNKSSSRLFGAILILEIGFGLSDFMEYGKTEEMVSAFKEFYIKQRL